MTKSILAVIILLATLGCAKQYTAASLPVEYRAVPITDPHTIDMTPLAGPSVSSDLIAPGDVLRVSIAGGLRSDEIIELSVRVEDTGAAILPEIGAVALAGLDKGQAERAIAGACVQGGIYHRPQVTITERHERTNQVTVVGAVVDEGPKELPRSSSYLLAALVAAGGLAPDAGTSVKIQRPVGSDPQLNPLMRLASATDDPGVPRTASTDGAGGTLHSVRLDLTQAGSQSPAEYLPDGSVVMVERRQLAPIYVTGLVRKPGEFEFPVGRPVRVLGAIALAGGLTYNIADRALVIRSPDAGGEPVVIAVNIQRAKWDSQENLLLAPGDTVSVEHNVPTMIFEALGLARFGFGATIPMF